MAAAGLDRLWGPGARLWDVTLGSVSLRHTAAPPPPYEHVLAAAPAAGGGGGARADAAAAGPGDASVAHVRVESEGRADGSRRLVKVQALLGRLEAVSGCGS